MHIVTVCMYVCMYACMYACMYVCVHACVQKEREIDIYIYICPVHICSCTSVYLRACVGAPPTCTSSTQSGSENTMHQAKVQYF